MEGTDEADNSGMEFTEPTVADLVVMDMLRVGIPLSLLCDLVPVDGPHSLDILAAEAMPTG